MSKFKIGDVVVPTTEEGKKEFNGTSLVVSECNKCFVRFNNEPAMWNPDAFELSKEETMKLELGGKYRKVGTHEPVRIICTDRVSSDVAKEFTCVSLVRTKEDFEYMSVTTAEGKDLLGETLFEEVPEVDWSKIPVDTPIWIVDGKNVHKRHFNKFENNYVHHWPDGKTSFTAGCGHFSYRNKPEYCYLENPEV